MVISGLRGLRPSTLVRDALSKGEGRGWSLLLVIAAAGAALPAQNAPALHLPPLDRVLPPRAETIYRAIAPRIDTTAAMDVVTFMAPRWRLAGNPAYDASIDFIRQRLAQAGLTPRVDEYQNSGRGWEQVRGTLSIAQEAVLSREQDRVALCINSFSTAAGGVTLPLIDVGAGAVSDFDGKNVKGAVVLGNAGVGQLWTRAVRDRGAAGVISTDVARYTRPESTPDVLQWGSIPYDESRRSFGFKATPRAAARLREALAGGPLGVRVDIETNFHDGPNRTLIAEIAGSTDERVVLAAHVQEPGANDNASGSGTLLAVAAALHQAITSGSLARPRRTITFLWLDEIRGSEQWLKQNAARAVVAMMSLDMTGQDTAKTGGTFLIEKMPDPSAIYPRPSDPHSEWGAGEVDKALVKGHLLNDFHLAVALRRARETGWVVRTNPYEGGSDHTVFTRAGVPALLNWHFTDRYYHTNLDTADKTSPATMGHVATAVATSALFLASADASDAAALTKLVNEAERARMATEEKNGASGEIVSAWKKWYDEARASVALIAR